MKFLKKRRINIGCVQEIKLVGTKVRHADEYKLWYSGGASNKNGVSILLDIDLRERMIEVRRINHRMMTVKLVVGTWNIISAYVPQANLDEED